MEERLVTEPLFNSETSLTPDGWSVIARIPLDGLFRTTHPEWLLSFGRYDYTPGQTKPVISSTSPHAICNFHRKEEWRRVRLADLSENLGAVPHFMGVKGSKGSGAICFSCRLTLRLLLLGASL